MIRVRSLEIFRSARCRLSRLSGGLVASLNRKIVSSNLVTPIDKSLVAQSDLQKSLLFEIAVARAELEIEGLDYDWSNCIQIAFERQARHFDVHLPSTVNDDDRELIYATARNLVILLNEFASSHDEGKIIVRPEISGFGWMASGNADFEVGLTLVEVKNTDRNFVANDFGPILLYWLLDYADSLEGKGPAWQTYLLINPRLNRLLFGSFDELITAASGGLNRVEVYQYLRSVVTSEIDRRR